MQLLDFFKFNDVELYQECQQTGESCGFDEQKQKYVRRLATE